MNIALKRILLLSVAVILLSPVSAQALPATPSSQADPSRVQGQFEDKRFDSVVKPKINIKETALTEAPKGADKIKMILSGIKLSGAQIYTVDEIQKLYTDRIGQTITLADLYTIAQEITRKYRNDGYVLTQVVVPPQTIGKKGTAELRIVEGYIADISIEGTKSEKEKLLVTSYLNRLDKDKALNIKDLEHALLLMNSTPGIVARSVLSPSVSKIGAADLAVIVDHKAYEGSFGLNNYGTKYLGETQASTEMSFNSLLGNNEKITTQFVITPSSETLQELFYVSAAYSQPINQYGTSFTLSANNTNTTPGSTLDLYDTKGRSNTITARFDHPIVRNRSFNVKSNIQFDYTNSRSKDNLGAPVVRDRTRVVRLGGSVDFLDTLFKAGYNSISLTASRGVDVMNATDEQQGDTTRPDSDGNNFKKIEAEIIRQQLISNSISLLLAAKGQLSAGPLLSSEEFGFGGINWGRGYDNSEIIGDDGYAAKAEIQWNDPVKVDFVDSYSVFAFYDLGKTWNNDASFPLDKQTRTSTGLGLRADIAEDVTANAILALPLNREVLAEGDDNPRIFAGISKSF